MNAKAIGITLAAALLVLPAARAGEFDGGWLGGKVGANRSGVTGVDKKSATAYGLEGGYNWNRGNFLLGVNGFIDSNDSAGHNPAPFSYGSSAYGLDLKLGLPSGSWLPYAKLGYAQTDGDGAASAIGDGGVHFGLGVEYKFNPNWSVAGEYTATSAETGAQKLTNDNFTIGLNYYFGAPAPVAPVVPVAKAAEPMPAPKPAVSETWKTLLENKPVCIEGANFEFDSSRLRDGEIKKLNEVVAFANEYPDVQLESGGHTCSIGTEEYNQKLSERRAGAVKDYLVKRGVAAQRIVVVGYGESRPMADNNTREGRELNRRVEVCTVLKVEKKVRVTE